MSALSDKLRKARTLTIDVGLLRWTVRRPTDYEYMVFRREGIDPAAKQSLYSLIDGWAKVDGSPVTEVDLGMPNGDPHPLEFDRDAATEYFSDHMKEFQTIVERVYAEYASHTKAQGEAAKN